MSDSTNEMMKKLMGLMEGLAIQSGDLVKQNRALVDRISALEEAKDAAPASTAREPRRGGRSAADGSDDDGDDRSASPPRQPKLTAATSRTSEEVPQVVKLEPGIPKEFLATEFTYLIVQPERAAEVKAIKVDGEPLVRHGPCNYRADAEWFAVPKGGDLLLVEKFWKAETRTAYNQARGIETFSRKPWTPLTVNPGDPGWAKLSDRLEADGIRPWKGKDKTGKEIAKLPPNMDLLPYKEYVPKHILAEHERKGAGRDRAAVTAR